MRKYPERIRSKKPPRVTLYRCRMGHVSFHEHPSCPFCGQKLQTAKTWGRGLLISHTTLKITPTGEPFTIGVFRHSGGAKSLCRIIGDIRGQGRDRVSILRIDGRFYVFGRGTRVAYRGDLFRGLPAGFLDIPIP